MGFGGRRGVVVPGDKVESDMSSGELARECTFEVDGSCFDQVLSGTDRPVVVQFLTGWCSLCHSSAAHMEQVSAEMGGRACFVWLDAERSPEVAARFGVESVPTVIVFRGRREAARMVGLRTREELLDRLELASMGPQGFEP